MVEMEEVGGYLQGRLARMVAYIEQNLQVDEAMEVVFAMKG